MGWLDPIECKAARDYLRLGQVAEAARLLLQSKNRDHRAVRQLLGEVGKRLVEHAKAEAELGHVEAAWNAVELAGQCVTLEGEGLTLRQRLQALIAEKKRKEEQRKQKEQWAAEKLAEAKQLADGGEFASAIAVLELLRADGFPGAAETLSEVRLRQERFTRAVADCEHAVGAGDIGLARHYLEKLRNLCPNAVQVRVLTGQLAALAARERSYPGTGPAPQPAAVQSRTQSFVLEDVGLVISTDQVAVGTPRGEDVQLPILGRIHRRHAVFVRDRLGWQLMVCRDKHGQACPVVVNEVEVPAVTTLADEATIQFGDAHCRLCFRLPVAGSLTALLEAPPGSSASIYAPPGQMLRRVILLADSLIIGCQKPAHVVLPTLPCRQVVFHWQEGGLHWSVDGAPANMEIPGRSWHPADRLVYCPAQLIIEATWDEAERLGRMMLDPQSEEKMVLRIRPWNRAD
ncbi:MAG: hypothetical protein NZ899_05620 [Thermoguttaceae bacterium]|nr:hypothetical protein [Thermoguttaceae bacterium]MDW8079419.1 hypothetical protein [Thermoguttaceae bacterium]